MFSYFLHSFHSTPHIQSQNEVAERRAFVTRTKQSLVKIWNNLESEYVKGKMSNDERDVSTYLEW